MTDESNAAAVFDLVDDGPRVDILQALARAHREAPTDAWVEYSDLQAAAGVRDNGNFNYHLDRLEGLVERGEAGYRLSRVGLEVVAALAAGDFDPEWTWGPVEAPGDCLFCDRDVELRYADGVCWLTCGRDDHRVGLSVSPALLDAHPESAVVEHVAFVEHHWGALTRQGICSECGGPVDGEVTYGGARQAHYFYHGDCRHCGYQHGIPVGLYLLSHPAVTTFYHDHGVDVRTVPFWTLEWCTPGSETVLSTDPLRLRVEVTHEGERLALTVDREGRVVETERSGE